MTPPMKVLFIASDNSVSSGAFLSMVKLAELLSKNKKADIMVVLPHEGDGQVLLEKANIHYQVIKSYDWIIRINQGIRQKLLKYKGILYNNIAVYHCCRLIDEYKPDIIHINTSYSYVGAIAGRIKHVPVVWHIREFLEEDQGRRIISRRAGYKTISKSCRILLISNALYNKYRGVFPNERMKVVYNGIDEVTFFRPEKELFAKKKVTFLCVGSLHKGKGQSLIISACHNLYLSGFKDFQLFIIGTGEDEERLRNQIRECRMEEYIHIEGYRNDTSRYYYDADILIMGSRSEAFGRVTVEAMMSGDLIVGANSGATPELIKDGEYGYLFAPGDAENLAATILYIDEHKAEARDKMRKGRIYAYNNFRAETNAERVYDEYMEILKYRD